MREILQSSLEQLTTQRVVFPDGQRLIVTDIPPGRDGAFQLTQHPELVVRSGHHLARLVRELPLDDERLYLDERLDIHTQFPVIPFTEAIGKKDATVAGQNLFFTTWDSEGFQLGRAVLNESTGSFKRVKNVIFQYGKVKKGSGIGAASAWVEDNKIKLIMQMEYYKSGPIAVWTSENDGETFKDPQVVIRATPGSEREVSYDACSAVVQGRFANHYFETPTRIFFFVGFSKTERKDNYLANKRTHFYMTYVKKGKHIVEKSPFAMSENNPFIWQEGEVSEWYGNEALNVDPIDLKSGRTVYLLTYATFPPNGIMRQRNAMSVYDPHTNQIVDIGLFLNPAQIKDQLGNALEETGHLTLVTNSQTNKLQPDQQGNILAFFMGRNRGKNSQVSLDNRWDIGRATINYSKLQDTIQSFLPTR